MGLLGSMASVQDRASPPLPVINDTSLISRESVCRGNAIEYERLSRICYSSLNIFTSRVSGRGHRIGVVSLCVCVCVPSHGQTVSIMAKGLYML